MEAEERPVLDPIDMALIAVGTAHPLAMIGALAAWGVRRSPRLCWSAMTALGAEKAAVAAPVRYLLPGLESPRPAVATKTPAPAPVAPAPALPEDAPAPVREPVPAQAPAPAPAPVRERERERAGGLSWRTLIGRPALFIYGTMGSGKTTLIKAVIAASAGEVVIINPKREDWGIETVTPHVSERGRDWSPVRTALAHVTKEVVLRTMDKAERTPLTVVLDDLPILARYVSQEIEGLFGEALFIGRSLGIRVILIGHSDRAGQTGTRGMHDTLLGLPRVEAREFRYRFVDGNEERELDSTGVRDGADWQAWQGSVRVIGGALPLDTPLAGKTNAALPRANATERCERPERHTERPERHTERPEAPEANAIIPRANASERPERPAEAPEAPEANEEQALAHALELHAGGTGKAAAILAAFGFKKGSSQGYQRAAALFDAALRKDTPDADRLLAFFRRKL